MVLMKNTAEVDGPDDLASGKALRLRPIEELRALLMLCDDGGITEEEFWAGVKGILGDLSNVPFGG
jgi:hypothetical protein